jgi:N6-adenosine-specific RNA methylase IME4
MIDQDGANDPEPTIDGQPTVRIAGYEVHPAAQHVPPLRGDEFVALAADIRKHGLRLPIVLYQGMVLDGRARLAICEMLGVEPRFEEWEPENADPYAYVWSLNGTRRHLDEGQRALLAVMLYQGREEWRHEQVVRRAAANAARSAAMFAHKVDHRLPSPSAPPPGGAPDRSAKTRSRAARDIADWSHTSTRSVQRAIQLLRSPCGRTAEVLAGDLSLSGALRAVKVHQAAEDLRGLPPLCTIEGGPFAVIVADPAWPYDIAELPYPSSTLEDIRSLALPPVADDATLWLWTTNAHMEAAFGVARNWGFEPKSILTWVKDRPGTGLWLQGQSEHCLLCIKGRPVHALHIPTTVLHAPRRGHSEKPDEFFELVDQLCPDPRRLELYGRKPRTGWVVWPKDMQRAA